jgi:NAD(P)-dependent dehydrogenase (short-subunit alcohol dehydrogenase family)
LAQSERFLEGVPVAVTGGARGIGRAIAEHLARAGARVTIGDIDGEEAEAVAAAIGGGAVARVLDVSDPEQFEAFLAASEEAHGPLGVLVNNAGVDWIGPFHEQPLDAAMREIQVNLVGAVIGSRLAVGRMLPRRQGHLVNIASGAGRVPLPGSAVYSATKHGVVGLTESLRLEYRDSGVRFSLIQPSQVTTAMMDGQARPRLMAQITPDAVAVAVLDALRRNRFEVWVPSSQGVTAKLGNVLPRRAREAVLRAVGVGKIAGDVDSRARRDYHQRAFRRDS